MWFLRYTAANRTQASRFEAAALHTRHIREGLEHADSSRRKDLERVAPREPQLGLIGVHYVALLPAYLTRVSDAHAAQEGEYTR